MKKIIKQLFCASFIFLTVISCSKKESDESEPNQEKQIETYIAGFVVVGSGGSRKQVATVWKNGVAQSLANSDTESSAYKVTVVGNDVYVAGREYVGSKSVAKLWKNGIGTSLITSNNNSETLTVAVSAAGDVYTLIREWSNIGSEYKVFKNGALTTLNRSNSNNKIYPYDLFTSGNDVYVTGIENDFNTNMDKATLWKNGIPTTLPSITRNTPTSGFKVFVSGNDVYVLGLEVRNVNDVIVLWKNGIPSSVTDGTKYASPNALYVDNTNVYITGSEYNQSTFSSTHTLWQNGKAIFSITGNNDLFTSVSAIKNDVYLATDGYNNTPFGSLLKNGQPLFPIKENSSFASVFVLEK